MRIVKESDVKRLNLVYIVTIPGVMKNKLVLQEFERDRKIPLYLVKRFFKSSPTDKKPFPYYDVYVSKKTLERLGLNAADLRMIIALRFYVAEAGYCIA